MWRKRLTWLLPMTVMASAACATDTAETGGGGEAEDFPSSPITMIVPYEPGGSIDTVARELQPALEEAAGVSVEIVNREGGAGAIGTTEAIQAEPDGYTLGFTTTSIIGLGPPFQDGLAFEDLSSYEPVVRIGPQPHILYVAADSPLKDLTDFVEAAKAQPGELRVANSGANSSTDLTMADLESAAGIEVTDVPASGADALVEVLGGRVDAAVGSSGTVTSDIDAGKVRVIGAFSEGAHPVFPDVQTAADAGYPDTGIASSPYIVVPSGVDESVLTALRDIAARMMDDPDLQDKLKSLGFEVEPETSREALEGEISGLHDKLRALGLME